MHGWLSGSAFGAVIGILLGAALIGLNFLVNPSQRKHLSLQWRPSGTRVNLAGRAALALGVAAGAVGIFFSILQAPPRWASPLLWTGFGVAMAAAFATGFTTRAKGSSSPRASA